MGREHHRPHRAQAKVLWQKHSTCVRTNKEASVVCLEAHRGRSEQDIVRRLTGHTNIRGFTLREMTATSVLRLTLAAIESSRGTRRKAKRPIRRCYNYLGKKGC